MIAPHPLIPHQGVTVIKEDKTGKEQYRNPLQTQEVKTDRGENNSQRGDKIIDKTITGKTITGKTITDKEITDKEITDKEITTNNKEEEMTQAVIMSTEEIKTRTAVVTIKIRETTGVIKIMIIAVGKIEVASKGDRTGDSQEAFLERKGENNY